MFNNLIYISIVLVALETGEAPLTPGIPYLQALLIFLFKLVAFWISLRVFQVARKTRTTTDYFRTESALSVLAVLVFLFDIYLLDLRYYLGLLPYVNQLPVLTSLLGLALFYFYLALVWLSLRKDHERLFKTTRQSRAFLSEQFLNSAVVVVPWLVLSVLYSLLVMIPIPVWQIFLAGNWGEPTVFLGYLTTLPFWLPGLLVKMMGCSPLPQSEERRRIEEFCKQQGVVFREICLWPLFGGKILSAGVIGFAGKCRYLLLTPGLLDIARTDELEAVIAHEIGHIKKHHLLLYLFLFMAFWIFLQFALEPMLQAILGSQLLLTLIFTFEVSPSRLAPFIVGIPLLITVLFYIRFIFGFFMRNFERQADLHSYHAIGGAGPLISILEKIAWLGGNIRDRPNWHHFGIGQRVDYLKDCEKGRRKPFRHELKVYSALAAFTIIFIVAIVTTRQLGNYTEQLTHPGAEFAEGFVTRKVETDPGNPLWLHLRGDMLANKKLYSEAVAAYEKSLSLQPNNPEVLNNLAWLYLTADKKVWRNPVLALDLAHRAAVISTRSHILDTLAEAQWQNGESAQAVATEQRAISQAKENRDYYRGQLEKFSKMASH